MKRTTIMLPDQLAELVDRERRRRDISTAAVIREAVEAYLAPPATPKTYSFIGIARSGGGEPTAANMEEWLAREALSDEAFNRMKYGYSETDQPTTTSEGTKIGPSDGPPQESRDRTVDRATSATG